MAGFLGFNVLIGRIDLGAAGVAADHVQNAFRLPEGGGDAPEASTGEIGGFHGQTSLSVPEGYGHIGVIGDDAQIQGQALLHDLRVVNGPQVTADTAGGTAFGQAGQEHAGEVGVDEVGAHHFRVVPGLVQAAHIQ